jgi:hypothetical protein
LDQKILIYNNNFILYSDEAPTVFVLFVLSHGQPEGIIQTHFIDPAGGYETFTTESVFEALKANTFLESAVKVLFLGVSFKL